MRLFNAMIIVTLLVLQPGTQLGAPPPPAYWFIEHVTLRPFHPPAGVSIAIIENKNGKIPAEYILIKNSSNIGLFIVGTPHIRRSKYEDIGVELPLGIEPLHKVVSGKAYQWQNGWSQNGRYQEEIDTLWLYIYHNMIFCDGDWLLDLDPRNQNGERPVNIQVPESQDVLLPVIYGTEYLYIPLAISYVINDEYQSAQTLDYNLTVYIVTAFIFILLFIIIFLWSLSFAKKRLLSKKRPPPPLPLP